MPIANAERARRLVSENSGFSVSKIMATNAPSQTYVNAVDPTFIALKVEVNASMLLKAACVSVKVIPIYCGG
jgi:hypothetical protein